MQSNLEPHIRQREAALKRRHPGVTDCVVTVQDRPAHRYECRRFNVRLDLSVAGRPLVINREHESDPAVAVDDVFDAASRELDRRGADVPAGGEELA